jgi:hypothetical protein
MIKKTGGGSHDQKYQWCFGKIPMVGPINPKACGGPRKNERTDEVLRD